jgi:hypothetical protein
VNCLAGGNEDLVQRAVKLVSEAELGVGHVEDPGMHVEQVVEPSGGAIADDRLNKPSLHATRGDHFRRKPGRP